MGGRELGFRGSVLGRVNGFGGAALLLQHDLSARHPAPVATSFRVPEDLQRIRDMSSDEIAALWRAHLDEVEPLQ